MQFNIHPFELKHRNLPTKQGVLLEKEGRFSEISILPGRSKETYAEMLLQLQALQKGWKGPLFPSVEFGLYGLSAPSVSSIPCALLLNGTPEEVLIQAQKNRGFKVAKLKVGSWGIEQTLNVIQKLPFKLRLDFNNLWPPAKVEKLCSKLSSDQIEFLEDTGCVVSGFEMARDETLISHSTTVWKPMVRGLPALGQQVVLSSSLESSIGLHQIASLVQSYNIPAHILGIGTIDFLENDLVQNQAFLKDGHLHFPSLWVLLR